MKPTTRCLLAILVLAVSLCGQSVTLRTGEVLIGRVVDVTDGTFRMELTFPKEEMRELSRAEIIPRSVYDVLAARIDQGNGGAHLDLAAVCEDLGLFAFAIAEARQAAKLDPALGAKAKRVEQQSREQIAARILQAAQADFEDGRLGSAQLAAHAVAHDYGDTRSARDATKLAAKIADQKRPSAHEATGEEIASAVKSVRSVLEKVVKDLDVPAHGDMRQQRGLQRAISRLEKVWSEVGDLVAPRPPVERDETTTAASPAERLEAVQDELRARLTTAYLALGTIYLERRALPDADEWCNKACDLDPENKSSHALHRLILQAKIVDGWGY
ncbi:MAG: hypothetical protein IPM29_14405 [Planctomycetes bacterium]|nr:hypothetical protein [Planctomycetota bacterium]